MKQKQTIVIADDDADDREIIRDAFSAQNGHLEYVMIENGDQLMRYLESCLPDALPMLIMLDLNMPGKDGREALKEIKSHEQLHFIPTIVFTTSSSARDRHIVYDLGANCFITKPDTFNKLVDLTDSIYRLWLTEG